MYHRYTIHSKLSTYAVCKSLLDNRTTYTLYTDSHHTLNEILFRESEIIFRESEILFRESEILFRESEILFRESEILFRENEILFRESEIIFREKLSCQCSGTDKTRRKNRVAFV